VMPLNFAQYVLAFLIYVSGVGSTVAIAAKTATFFRPKMPHLQTLRGLEMRLIAMHYTLIRITHEHAHVFIKVLVGVARVQLSLTQEPEVKHKMLITKLIFSAPSLILSNTAYGLSTFCLFHMLHHTVHNLKNQRFDLKGIRSLLWLHILNSQHKVTVIFFTGS